MSYVIPERSSPQESQEKKQRSVRVRGGWRGFGIGLTWAGLLWGGWIWTVAEPAPPWQELVPLVQPKSNEPPLLQEDIPISAVLNLADEEIVSFRVEVPKEAILMGIRISRCPAPIDILVKKGEPIQSLEDADYHFMADVLDNTLRISRQSAPPLEEGTYYVAVAHLGTHPIVVHKRLVQELPFTITLSLIRGKPATPLIPGQKCTGQIRAEEGSLQTFLVDVPADAPVLRIDLDEVSGDLDLWARYGQPAYRRNEAANTAISPMGRETLFITPNSPEPLRAGRWYIQVVHAFDEGVVDFAIYASLKPDPPQVVLNIPELAIPEDGLKRGIVSTVEVATEYGAASGTLISPSGLVLTNYHVVAEVAENPLESLEQDPVVIAVTVDPALPPKELFRGRVVRFDIERDLALVQITCGLYHQPLPAGYRFPTITLGTPSQMEMGEEVRIVGFPAVGGSGGRVSLTLTQGILSGFEKSAIGILLKTDALIAPGSSGGAALDRHGRLIGVPTSENVVPEVVSRMSYIHPITMVPEEWWKIIHTSSIPKPQARSLPARP